MNSTTNICSVCKSNICELDNTLSQDIIAIIENLRFRFNKELINHPSDGSIYKLYQRIGREEAARTISQEVGKIICHHVRETLEKLGNSQS